MSDVLLQVLLYPLLQMSDLQTYSYRYFRREMDGLAVVGERTASATALFRV